MQKQKEQEPEIDSYFLCRRSAANNLIVQATHERDIILEELRAFYTGDINIRIYAVEHVTGSSISGDLLVNGEVYRTYDPVDLCFLDLTELMLKQMLQAGLPFGRPRRM